MGPFIRANNTTTKIMRNILLALLPLILFAVYKHGYIPYANNKIKLLGLFYPLAFIIVGALTSFLIEFIYYKFIKCKPNEKI
jgi:Na+-translocating ferredoxin:NAD+ oxidoreductase RnfD subunit